MVSSIPPANAFPKEQYRTIQWLIDQTDSANRTAGIAKSRSKSSTVQINQMLRQTGDMNTRFEEATSAISDTLAYTFETANGKNSVYYQDTPPTEDDIHDPAGQEPEEPDPNGGDGTKRKLPLRFKVDDLWFDTSRDNLMHTWNGDEWEEVQFGSEALRDGSISKEKIEQEVTDQIDQAVRDAATAAGDVGRAYDEARRAASVADEAKGEVTAATRAAENAQTKADEAVSAAGTATQAALDAAGIAEGKGQIIFQASKPTGSRANANNLWIRSSDNKPHIYNGTDWVPATDKAVIDAAAAAATAQSRADTAVSRADAAHTTAGEARDIAAAARDTASAKNQTFRSTGAATGTASNGDTWEQWSSLNATGRLIAFWRHNGSSWVKGVLDESYLPQVNIGQGTYGAMSGDRLEANSVKADKVVMDQSFASAMFANRILVGPEVFAPGPGGFEGAWDLVRCELLSNSMDRSGVVLHFNNGSGDGQARGPLLPVKPGDTFFLEAEAGWFGSSTTGGSTSLRMEWFDSPTGSRIGQDTAAVIADGVSAEFARGTVTAPANATYGRFYVYVSNQSGSGRRVVRNMTARPQTGGELIVDGSILAGKIAAGAIESAHIATKAITGPKLADGSVGTVAIADVAITNAKIASLAVGSAEIQNLAVTNAKIANLAINNAKIANLDAGKITTGFLGGDRIAGNAIDGKTITGATVRTAASGSRVQLDGLGLRTFNGSGQETSRITSDASALEIFSPFTGGFVTIGQPIGSTGGIQNIGVAQPGTSAGTASVAQMQANANGTAYINLQGANGGGLSLAVDVNKKGVARLDEVIYNTDEVFTMSPSVGSGRIVITRKGPMVEIVYEVYSSFGTSGHVQIGTIPARFRPPSLLSAGSERRSAGAWFGGVQYGSAALFTDGRLFVANTTGATRSEVNGSLPYFL